MSCCPADSEPARTTATHYSDLMTVGETTIYRAGPRTARVGVLAFPDAFGIDSGRAKQDADRLGELGYAVALVDLTSGDYGHDDGWDVLAWLKKHDFDSVLMPRIQDAVQHLQVDAKVEQLASYGYCWGAWVGALLSTELLVQGHVSFHPSWNVADMLDGDGSIDKLANKVRAPQLLLSAANEPASLQEGGSVQQLLVSHTEENVRRMSRVVDFPDVKHGWVSRGDAENATVKESIDKAWQLARAFLRDATSVV